ncbi:MAG: DUF3012 domain-containing protein [Nitrosomonadales bacterium]|jgi:hypothetical protein|nr:MAG: DUF3012 domain-containing protein [Nitrosomonadales bacterium]
MSILKESIFLPLLGIFMVMLTACAPEVGSDGWCANMNEKPKADWTVNELGDFARHCILK